MRRLLVPIALSLSLVSCGGSNADARTDDASSDEVDISPSASVTTGSTTADVATAAPSVGMSGESAASTKSAAAVDTAIFAGGCFWCMEPPYDKLDGVLSTTSGYTSGAEINPTYEQVSAGRTGHTEAVQVAFDPARFSQPIATEIVAATPVYAAEEYHQDYYMKNLCRYKFYRGGCGRDGRLEEIWGDEAGT